MRYAAILLLFVGCSPSVAPAPVKTAAGLNNVGDGNNFPLGTPSPNVIPAALPTAQTPAVINHLATLTPAAAAATSGCAGCSGMTMTIGGAPYPGYGSTFNGVYHFTRFGNDPMGCQFTAQSSGTWFWWLRPSSRYGGWELICQLADKNVLIYHTSTDPSNGGTGWTATDFTLIFANCPQNPGPSLTVN